MYDKKDIVYPIFIECCKFTKDHFWETIFEELACGKTPYGAFISKDFICCNYKHKEFIYKIESDKDPLLMYNEIYDLFVNKLGLLSYQQKIKKRLEFTEIEENLKESRLSWSSIKKKNIKELLIEKYIVEMKNKYYLSVKQCNNLISTIFIAMIFKVITPKDIIYQNGKIIDICGISFSKKKIRLRRNLFVPNINIKPEIIIDRKSVFESWEKYIKDIKKI